MLAPWLEEYDELASDVLDSNYKTFQLNVQRWLDFIDDHPLIAAHIWSWEQTVDFKAWYSAQTRSSSMAGSGQLNWPREFHERLALQLGLFRQFGSGELQLPPFALHFTYVRDGDFNVQTANICQHLFRPFVRELRRAIQKLDLTNQPAPIVPASDRVVELDHNSDLYKAVDSKISELLEAVEQKNDYDDASDKEQRLAELRAGKTLLLSVRVSLRAVSAVLVPCARYLAKTFGEQTIGIIAGALLMCLAQLFGIHF